MIGRPHASYVYPHEFRISLEAGRFFSRDFAINYGYAGDGVSHFRTISRRDFDGLRTSQVSQASPARVRLQGPVQSRILLTCERRLQPNPEQNPAFFCRERLLGSGATRRPAFGNVEEMEGHGEHQRL